MEVQKYIDEQKELYCLLYEYNKAEDATSLESNFNKLIDFYQTLKSGYHGEKLLSFLSLFNSITENHHRDDLFYDKIKKILLFFAKDIKQTLSNLDLFKIFENNKSILLFLLTNEIMSIDDSIAQFIYEKRYATFFNTELKKFFSQNQSKTPIWFNENETKEIPDFERNRLNGENEKYICSLIRQDSVVEFISHVNKTNVNLSKMKIEGNSIFETNPFLMKQSATLIEYAAFYGSINIFKYLRNNNVEIEPRLWLYGIHSNNAEIICLIEELNIKPDKNDYESYLEESIKCHHNEIASYIYDNFIDKTKEIFLENVVRYGFNYNNYFYINDIKNKYTFYYACEFGYINLVDLLIKHTKIDLNKMISSKFTALNLAAKNDNQDILNLLLSQKEIKIDKECFKGCSELTEITIPSTVHVIPEGCFCNCSKLKKSYNSTNSDKNRIQSIQRLFIT